MFPNLTLSPRARDALIAVTCVASVSATVLWARVGAGVEAFPLDDAYIFQVYARNLAQSGQWAFVPGVASAGATSILWPVLIAPAYSVGIDGPTWTLLLGAAGLIMTALGAARLTEGVSPNVSLATGLAVALEWHMVWAAASGMETILFAALIVWRWVWLRRNPAPLGRSWTHGVATGVWAGALALARPEGLLVGAISGLCCVLTPSRLSDKARWLVGAAIGCALLLMPQVALNLSSSGTLWPNTFYAKQAEYETLWQTPYLSRLLGQLIQPWIGAQALLLPAAAYELYKAARRRPVDWLALLPLIWALSHAALYAARLPVIYQHGRYAMPLVPLALAYGVSGLAAMARPQSRNTTARIGSLAWGLATAVSFPAFLAAQGAPAYARDAQFVKAEMVATAKWVAENTGRGDMLAVHDIGALGYYAPRPLVDLAGLVSPDVVPFMTDPDQLERHIVVMQADYLVVFPGWSPAYSDLVSRPVFCKVWSSDQMPGYVAYSPEQGPMTVYRVAADGVCS